MTSSVGVLDFFVVEANEYIGRLDGVLAAAGEGEPDLETFGRFARALRGSATMSRQQGIATLAAGLERVARAIRSRAVPWDRAAGAVLVSTVDDLRVLLRNVRSWGGADDARVQVRSAELERLAPSQPRRTPHASAASGSAFLSSETTDLAQALDRFVATGEHEALSAVTERVRALRGVADVRDLPPLPDVMEAVEGALKSIELTTPAAATPKQKALFTAAAALLRRAARDIAARGRPSADLPELAPFTAALQAIADDSGKADRIVPVTQLFYEDGGPSVVSAAPHPPTTPAERFRLEVVSLAEHLRLVVAEARAHPGPEHRDRIARDLRNALRALGSAANSFGERLVAHFAAEWSACAANVDATALAAIDSAATLLANPTLRADELARGLERLAASRTVPSISRQNLAAVRAEPTGAAAPARAPATAPPAPPAPPTREPIRTPTGRDLHAYLQDGLAGFRELEKTPLSQPAVLPDETIVPIDSLVYRGRAALERAAQLRQELLRPGASPSREAVQELFDLIDLALFD
jgi:chemotaxis protein histidine kinase CheA